MPGGFFGPLLYLNLLVLLRQDARLIEHPLGLFRLGLRFVHYFLTAVLHFQSFLSFAVNLLHFQGFAGPALSSVLNFPRFDLRYSVDLGYSAAPPVVLLTAHISAGV
jgi:hypothetical protein